MKITAIVEDRVIDAEVDGTQVVGGGNDMLAYALDAEWGEKSHLCVWFANGEHPEVLTITGTSGEVAIPPCVPGSLRLTFDAWNDGDETHLLTERMKRGIRIERHGQHTFGCMEDEANRTIEKLIEATREADRATEESRQQVADAIAAERERESEFAAAQNTREQQFTAAQQERSATFANRLQSWDADAASHIAASEDATRAANQAATNANAASTAASTARDAANSAASHAAAEAAKATTAAAGANQAKTAAEKAAQDATAAKDAAETATNQANAARDAANTAAETANAAADSANEAAARANEASSGLEAFKQEVTGARSNYVGHAFDTIGERMDAIEHTIHAISQDIELDAKAIHEIIQSGEATEVFQIGDQLAIPWTDTAAGTQHVFMADVCHHFDGSDADHPLVKLEDGSMVKGIGLQFHRTIPFGVVFSPKQAFYCTESGLAAGTYCFDVKVETTWGSTGEWATKGTRTYQFTAPQAIPAGGQLVFASDLYSAKAAGTNIQCFAPFGTSAIFTAALSEGAGGTKLGEITTACHDGFNAYPRATYGNNAWRESCEREWLNSAEAKGAWNYQKSPWDRPHALATTKAGFLAGLSEDFRSLLANCSQLTETHPGDPANGSVVETFDRFFPLSARQHYFSNYLSATAAGYASEGVPWDYWKKLAAENGKTAPWAGWGTFPELITYDNTSVTTARNVWLRSASRAVAYSGGVGCVHASGYVSYGTAANGLCAAPACIIY